MKAYKMKDRKSGHKSDRAPRGFDSHRVRSAPDHGGYKRGGQAWNFYTSGRRSSDVFEPHFRSTARIQALPGKHMRSVRQPVRAAHVKGA